MKNKLAIAMILLMCSFLLIPPMFEEDGIFDVMYIVKICDVDLLTHGKYYDNVFNIILLTMLSFIFVAIPYLFSTLSRYFKWISTMGGSWIIAALLYQFVSVIMPNSSFLEAIDIGWTSYKFASLFTVGILLITLHEIWDKEKS